MFTSAATGAGSDPYSDRAALLTLHRKLKSEAFAYQQVFERQWQRILLYVLNRQWIVYDTRRGQWRDKNMAKWIPRPVTNKIQESWVSLRAMLSAIDLNVIVRPNGRDPKNVITASVADEIEPLIKADHHMSAVLREFDSWFAGLGNALLHVWWDQDVKYGSTSVQQEQCVACAAVVSPADWKKAEGCPGCGGQESVPAVDPITRQPIEVTIAKGRGCTDVISPFEVGLPPNFQVFEQIPYIYRKRWRDKSYYQDRLDPKQFRLLNFSKTPADRSLQLFQEIARQSDLSATQQRQMWSGGNMSSESEGITEYELWMKPNRIYPEGLVLRVAGEGDEQIIEIDDESPAPGPIPIKDVEGMPLWPWAHAAFEPMGGRILGLCPLEVAVGPQDSLNRLDSMIELSVTRMANPVWLEPKGAEVEKFTGAPGLVVKYNMLGANSAKPERLDGSTSHLGALYQLREQRIKDIEEVLGTFDILKGQKPAGVEAFAALQLLVERSQSRFATAFGTRGDAYRQWYSIALEYERQFGPDTRVKALMGPNKKWAYKEFERSQLQGSVTIIVEDGTNVPKTSLGKRAAIDHANQLGVLNVQDSDTSYALMGDLGLTHLVPGLDSQVSEALQRQDAFEQWVGEVGQMKQQIDAQMGGPLDQGLAPQAAPIDNQPALGGPPPDLGMTPDPATGTFGMGEPAPAPVDPYAGLLPENPLTVRMWDDNLVHIQQCAKWANSDAVRELIKTNPEVVAHIEAYIQSHMQAMVMKQMLMAGPQPAAGAGAGPGGGGGSPASQAMENSNREAGRATPGHQQQAA